MCIITSNIKRMVGELCGESHTKCLWPYMRGVGGMNYTQRNKKSLRATWPLLSWGSLVLFPVGGFYGNPSLKYNCGKYCQDQDPEAIWSNTTYFTMKYFQSLHVWFLGLEESTIVWGTLRSGRNWICQSVNFQHFPANSYSWNDRRSAQLFSSEVTPSKSATGSLALTEF